jgi:branched-subunit amino acid ABC-type transport system permease component
MFCAFIYWQMRTQWGWSAPVALVGTIVVVPTILAVVTEALVYRRLASSSVFARTAASVGVLLALYGLSVYLWGDYIARSELRVPSVFPTTVAFRLPGVVVGKEQVGVVLSVLAIVVLLFSFLRFTRWGIELRAVVINRNLAELRGIDGRRTTRLSWIASYILAAIAGVIIAPLIGADPLTLTLIVVYSLAAAVLGGLVSLPLAMMGGVLLGLADSLVLGYVPPGSLTSDARGVLPFALLFVALVAQGRRLVAAHDASSRTAMLADLGPAAFRRKPAVKEILVRMGIVVALVCVLQATSLNYALFVMTTGAGLSLIFLSYRVFTATTGLVSLAQGAFAGIGAFTTASLVGHGWPWIPAVLVAAVVAAIAGAIVALPTVRLRGVFLALATLAFALLADQVVFKRVGFTGGDEGKALPRPAGFESNLSYLLLLIAIFGVIGYLCERFQYSRIGRELQADLSSSAGSRSIGIRPERARLLAFMLAAAVAGVGGSLYAAQVQHVSIETWTLIPAFLWLTMVAMAGVGSTGLMLEMAVLSVVAQEFVKTNFPHVFRGYVAIGAVGALLFLRVPGGIAGIQLRTGRAIQRRFRPGRVDATPIESDPLDDLDLSEPLVAVAGER